FGYDYFEINDIENARKQFWQSIQYMPLNLTAWRCWGISWLGTRRIKNLKTLKRRMRLENANFTYRQQS
ncbi:MAG: hypothetical protein KGJ11_05605, partial [Candidatus Omnitrophica bacterium]|nr:hypothetical protein [Candidatus Omnitrophota bacterium]